MSKKKEFRGLTPTTNHRFIALMLRWGKKSKSYNIFLNALYQCKQLFDLSIQSVGKGTMEIVDNEKNNKTQNFPIKDTLKKGVKNIGLSPEKFTLERNKINAGILENNLDIYRGTWNRFRKNLLVFNRNPENTSISSITKRNLEIKVRFSESLYYNFTDLCTTSLLDSQIEEEHTFLFHKTQSQLKQFCVNKRLISRRVGLEVPAIFELLKQSITTKKFKIRGLIFPGFRTDTFILNLAPVLYITKILQSKRSHHNSFLLSSYLKSKEITKIPTSITALNEKLTDCAQNNKEQDLINTPRSVLSKKKKINAKIHRGVHGVERITIGIDSVNRVCPSVETRKVRIGGATYAVPYVPHNSRQEGLGIRWLIACASVKKQRSKHPSELCLANELLDSIKKQGESIKKRDQSHQIAASNRAYTRYRWW